MMNFPGAGAIARTLAVLAAACLTAACATAPPVSSAARAELAPAGTLHAGIHYGNVVLATRNSQTVELTGVHVDLAREPAWRANVAVELTGYASAGAIVDGLKRGVLDVALLSAEPAREGEINFSPAYVGSDATYLVPAGSPIRDVAPRLLNAQDEPENWLMLNGGYGSMRYSKLFIVVPRIRHPTVASTGKPVAI